MKSACLALRTPPAAGWHLVPKVNKNTTMKPNQISRRAAALLAAAIAIASLSGCATEQERIADSRAIIQTWYCAPDGINRRENSFESDSIMVFTPDGNGALIARHIGYSKPGTKFGTATGCGAYKDVATWPIKWQALGHGRFSLSCTKSATRTGPGIITTKPLTLRDAKLRGDTLHLRSPHSNVIYKRIDPADPRWKLSKEEEKRRLAYWAKEGPKKIAETDARLAASAAASSNYAPSYTPVYVPTPTYVAPTSYSGFGPPRVQYPTYMGGGVQSTWSHIMNR
jgi:hypothetical protein